MNFTSLAQSGPLPSSHIPADLAWKTADISPFATALTGQVMTCTSERGGLGATKHIRWILNDAVLPLTGVKGCPENEDGLCPLDTWVSAMKERISTIDFHHDCFAEYEASDQIVNGRPPNQY